MEHDTEPAKTEAIGQEYLEKSYAHTDCMKHFLGLDKMLEETMVLLAEQKRCRTLHTRVRPTACIGPPHRPHPACIARLMHPARPRFIRRRHHRIEFVSLFPHPVRGVRLRCPAATPPDYLTRGDQPRGRAYRPGCIGTAQVPRVLAWGAPV
jgi:hypothetical protein